MSRQYNEEWQRRKSMLISSLFFDLPVLSPVPEESFESDHIQQNEPSEAPYRAYSPLPPLIIEKEPNRHDDSEEYYMKLLNKIKRIYKKLFIENQSLNSDDFNGTNSVNEDFTGNYESDIEMNIRVDNDNVSLNSNITINSEGYVADFESSNESNDTNTDMNVEESNDEQMDEENDTEPSNADKINQETNKNYLNNVSIDNEMAEARKSNVTSSNDSKSKSQDETANTDNYNQEMDVSDLNKTNEETNQENSNNVLEIDQEMVDERDILNKEMDLIVKDRNSKESEVAYYHDKQTKPDDGMDVCDDEADDTLDAGIDYRQITTVALVHVDGSQQNNGQVSPVYEATTSPILPPGVVIGGEEKGGHAVLEDQGDPAITSFLNEDDTTNEGIEEMRTPRKELSLDSNPRSRYCSQTSNHSPNIEITTALDVENTNHLLEPNISNDINEILTSIINDSNKEISFNRNSRKRKLYEDISVQTSRQVSWDEVKENFFVGPPKIFRLCRCVNHECSNFV